MFAIRDHGSAHLSSQIPVSHMSRSMNFRNVFLLIFLAFILGTSGFAIIKLFESLVTIPAVDIQSKKPIIVSQRVFLPGKCSVQLYGWFTETQDFGGADEYLRILKLETSLTSSSKSTSLVARRATQSNRVEDVWEILVPSGGVLTATISSYQDPSSHMKQAYAFMSCENGNLFKLPGVLFIAGIILGAIGVVLLVAILIRRIRRRL